MLPGQCCHTPEGTVIREQGKMLDLWTEKTDKTWRKKITSVPVHPP